MSNQCRIDVESMPDQSLTRGWRGRFKGGVRGPVPDKPFTTLDGKLSLRHPAGVPTKLPFSVSFSLYVNNRKTAGRNPCLSRRVLP